MKNKSQLGIVCIVASLSAIAVIFLDEFVHQTFEKFDQVIVIVDREGTTNESDTSFTNSYSNNSFVTTEEEDLAFSQKERRNERSSMDLKSDAGAGAVVAAGAGAGSCAPWPLHMSSDLLPFGPSMKFVKDDTNKVCNKFHASISNAFNLAFMNQSTARTITIPAQDAEIDCNDWSPSTVLMYSKLGSPNPGYNQIRKCFVQHNQGIQTNENLGLDTMDDYQSRSTSSANKKPNSYISLRQPTLNQDHHSDILTKDGISHLMLKYDDDCRNGDHDNCIFPSSFRIADVLEDCQAFFSIPNVQSMEWIIKPVAGFGGRGITLVRDFYSELQLPYGNCDPSAIGSGVIVQKFSRPLVLGGRSTHLRVFFLYKLGSRPILIRDPSQSQRQQLRASVSKEPTTMDDPTGTTARLIDQQQGTLQYRDPPQAWHIKVGNVHRCSEEYSKADDPILGDYAVKCNSNAWLHNPRLKREFKEKKKTLTYDELYASDDRPTYPYPQFLQQHMDGESYNLVMDRIDDLFGKIANVITKHTLDQKDFALTSESSWIVMGVDLVIESPSLKPKLIELNSCAGPPVKNDGEDDPTRNPYLSMWRVVMTHYLRHHLGHERYDENQCSEQWNMLKRVY